MWGWVVLPFLFAALRDSTLYNGGRQLLFALPPTFAMAGTAFAWIFGRVRWPIVRGAIVLAAALPGVVAIGRLHPYEYIYYNELVGGTEKAFRRFELDYFATSYREAMEILNLLSPAGAKVVVVGPYWSALLYADSGIVRFTDPESQGSPDYLIATTGMNLDETSWPHAPIVAEVKRGNAVLSIIRDLRSQIDPPESGTRIPGTSAGDRR